MEWLLDPHIWASFVTLSVLEIVLGIDNLVFVALLAGRLPREGQGKARTIGLSLALVTRLALLGSIAFLVHLTEPVVSLGGMDFLLARLRASCRWRLSAVQGHTRDPPARRSRRGA
jgi:predicted tellurium resistance membrane protein TerC